MYGFETRIFNKLISNFIQRPFSASSLRIFLTFVASVVRILKYNVQYCDKRKVSAYGIIISLLIEASYGRKVVEIFSNFLFETDKCEKRLETILLSVSGHSLPSNV